MSRPERLLARESGPVEVPVDAGLVSACARVTAVTDDAFSVVAARDSGRCPGCDGGCARLSLFDWWGAGDRPVRLPLALLDRVERSRIAVGSEVRLAMAERHLLLASVLVYLTPLAGMLVGALLVQAVGVAEPGIVGGAAVGLVAGWYGGRRLQSLWLPPLSVALAQGQADDTEAQPAEGRER